MTTFDDRKRQEETRFKHDQELAFKARNRGNKLFGLWIAEQLGLSGEAAQSYAKDVVIADFEAPGDDDIFTKVRADLEAKSIEISDHLLIKHLQDYRQLGGRADQVRMKPVPLDRPMDDSGRAAPDAKSDVKGAGRPEQPQERAPGSAGGPGDRRAQGTGADPLRRLGEGRPLHRLLKPPAGWR